MSIVEGVAIEERVERLEAEAAVRRLMADYAYGCDRRDKARFMGVFHPDAVYVVGGALGTARGAEEIEKTLEAIWEGSPETHHWITDVTVDLEGTDLAHGDGHTICFVRTAAGREGFVCADYQNRYERRDGIWRATSIALDVAWWKEVEFGDLLAASSAR